MLQSSPPFLRNMETTSAADLEARQDLGKRQKQDFGEGKNPWALHFVHAGPSSAPSPLSVGGCPVVLLSLSQTTTTTCLCWICTHTPGLWLRHKNTVNRYKLPAQRNEASSALLNQQHSSQVSHSSCKVNLSADHWIIGLSVDANYFLGTYQNKMFKLESWIELSRRQQQTVMRDSSRKTQKINCMTQRTNYTSCYKNPKLKMSNTQTKIFILVAEKQDHGRRAEQPLLPFLPHQYSESSIS